MPSIPEYYSGKHILVTGATGFMGKILVEKLLRSCPSIGGLYMIVRPKKSKNVKQRLDDFINQPIFDLLRDDPKGQEKLEKLHCIGGDVTKDNIGVSIDDLELLESKIDIIFHMAANVRFDQPLKEAVLMNTGGTLNVLEFSKKVKHLQAFIHVSTSYCHCDETVLEERLYPAPHDPRKMLDWVKWFDEDLIKELTPKILKNSPNTYAYTKCLTEQLVTEYNKHFPVAIARPSIVIASYKEPIPGWVDNLNGPTGIMVGAGKGVIRSMHCYDELNADIVPVDIAINDLILIAKELGTSSRLMEPMVVHLTSGDDNKISWGEALEMGKQHFFENPFTMVLWYPGGSAKRSYLVHMLCVIFLHYLPAYFIDFMMPLLGHKKFLVHTQKKVSVGLAVLQYYTTRPWRFHNEKIKKMAANLSETDQKVFYTDINEIHWNDYMLNYVKGARKYCMKEEPETVPQAKRTMKKLYIAHVIVKGLCWIFLFWFLVRLYSWMSCGTNEDIAALPTM